jgi:energy-coupling factor transport system ATP-binding protein
VTLVLEGVRYRYPGAASATGPALEGVDLVVGAGRVTGVVGANEAGKSTLCLVASGMAPGVVGGTLEGRVVVAGVDTTRARPHELAQRCGILFQDPATQLSGTAATAWEEVAFGPRNLGLPIAEVVERVEEALAALDIRDLAARDPARLSGGQGQLVALASILALRPACLVLDEPTTGLDPHGTRLVAAALERLARERGAAILVAEQRTELLARIADEVVVLEAGRPARSGPASEVLGDPGLEALGVEPPPAVRLQRALRAIPGEPARAALAALVEIAG